MSIFANFAKKYFLSELYYCVYRMKMKLFKSVLSEAELFWNGFVKKRDGGGHKVPVQTFFSEWQTKKFIEKVLK